MVHALDARDVSLDSRIRADSGVTLGETLVAGEASQEERLLRLEVSDRLHAAIAVAVTALDPRERYIVEKRLMADREDELSVTELETRAKKKLKTSIEKARRSSMESAMSGGISNGGDAGGHPRIF